MLKKEAEIFERVLMCAKPLKGQDNDFQYSKLKSFIPKSASCKDYENYINRICDKIKY